VGLLESLLTFVDTAMTGRLQPVAAPYLCAARLILLMKKDRGVSPIAVWETLRRRVAKWLLASSDGKGAARALWPRETGFLKKGGVRGVVHGVAGGSELDATLNWVGAVAGGNAQRLQLGSPGANL